MLRVRGGVGCVLGCGSVVVGVPVGHRLLLALPPLKFVPPPQKKVGTSTNKQQTCEDATKPPHSPRGTRPMHSSTRPPGMTDRISHATNTTQKQRHLVTAHSYAHTAHRTARSQFCGLSTGTYGYQTPHTHGRCAPPPTLQGRRSASAALLVPHTEQTHAHKLKRTDCAQGCEDATL